MMSSLSEKLGKGAGYVKHDFSAFEKIRRHCERGRTGEPFTRGFWIASLRSQ
jgi:hypothetical protein